MYMVCDLMSGLCFMFMDMDDVSKIAFIEKVNFDTDSSLSELLVSPNWRLGYFQIHNATWECVLGCLNYLGF